MDHPLNSTQIDNLIKFGRDHLGMGVDTYHPPGAQFFSCTNFVGSALKAVGAKDCTKFPGYNGGAGPDYEWADTTVVGFLTDGSPPNWDLVQRGDVIQLRNVVFSITIGDQTERVPFPENHNAIVENPLGGGRFLVLEQNVADFNNNPRGFVTEDTYDFSDLAMVVNPDPPGGGVSVYRPVAAD
jgi:hypothetical protein